MSEHIKFKEIKGRYCAVWSDNAHTFGEPRPILVGQYMGFPDATFTAVDIEDARKKVEFLNKQARGRDRESVQANVDFDRKPTEFAKWYEGWDANINKGKESSKFPKPARIYDNAVILANTDEKGFILSDEKQLIILFADGHKPTTTDYDSKSFIDKEDALEYARLHAKHYFMSVSRREPTNVVGIAVKPKGDISNVVGLSYASRCTRKTCRVEYKAGDKVLIFERYPCCPKCGGYLERVS